VDSLGVVELQGPGDRVQNRLRDAGGAATFEAGVVVGAQTGELRDLFAAKPRNPPSAVADDPRLLRGEPRPTADQELPHLIPFLHAPTVGRNQGS
jgi:hypothetical protein